MFDNCLKYKWDNQNALDTPVEEERMKALEEKRNIVREMKNDGLPIDRISRYTKLSIDEIENL